MVVVFLAATAGALGAEPAHAVDSVILRCVANGGDTAIPVTDSSSSPGAPAIAPFLTDCADALAGLLASGFRSIAARVDDGGAVHYTLRRSAAALPHRWDVVLLRCVPNGGDTTIPVTDSDVIPGGPVVTPFVADCAGTLAALLDDGYGVAHALVDGSGAMHFTLTRTVTIVRGFPPRGSAVVILRCIGDGGRVDVADSNRGGPGAPAFTPFVDTCAGALAHLLSRRFTTLVAQADDLDSVYYTLVRTVPAAPEVPMQAVTLRCFLPTLTHASSSPGAPVVAPGGGCATGLAGLLSGGFTLAHALVSALPGPGAPGTDHYTLVRRAP